MFRIVTARVLKKLGDAPERVLLFAEGWNELDADKDEPGRYLVDSEAFNSVVAEVTRRGIDLVWDYEHQTLTNEKAPAAGWIRGAEALHYQDGVGIVADVDWTAEAAGHIERGEYRYFSPVFAVSKKSGRLAALYNVALTNSPKHNHLKPILAKLGAGSRGTKEASMDFFKQLFSKLGLSDGATETETLAAVDTVVAKADAAKDTPVVAKEITEALGVDEKSDVSTVVASIHAAKHAPKGMVSREEFDTVVATLADRDAKDAVTAAMTAGKITPDQKDWAIAYAKKDLAGFTTFITKAAVVVPVEKLGKKETPADSVITDESVLAVAKMMGNTPEDLKKYGMAQ